MREAVAERACEGCGNASGPGEDQVCENAVRWTAWGKGAGDLRWWKHADAPLWLCGDCENEAWAICDDCGALVEGCHWGAGYVPESYNGPPICPDCAAKQGHVPTVAIGPPPPWMIAPAGTGEPDTEAGA